jgi:hypothetical protein
MDIKATLTEADQTFTGLLQLLSSISENQINTVPFAGSWTAAQDAQHIILSAGGFVQLLNGPTIDTERNPEQNCASVRAMFSNYDNKMQSPEFILPEDKQYDKQQLINTLQDIKAGFLKAIQTLDITKTCLAFELPGAGHITRAETITFTIVHTQRHVHQLKNISDKLLNNAQLINNL